MSEFKVSVIQLNSIENKKINIAAAEKLILEAAAVKPMPNLIVLPEYFSFYGDLKKLKLSAEQNSALETVKYFQKIALDNKINILLGSVPTIEIFKDKSTNEIFNRSYLISNEGKIAATYDKINLFNARLENEISESKIFTNGTKLCTFEINEFKFGISLCFDIRFPNLFQEYRKLGVHAVIVPAAFTHSTGKDHWLTLLKARAIENQIYIIAANQVGFHDINPAATCEEKHTAKIRSWGESAIIDPWGNVLEKADNENPEVISAILTKEKVIEIRSKISMTE